MHPCSRTHTLSLCLSLSLPIEPHHLKLGLRRQPGSCVAERKVIYSKVWPLAPPCNSRQLHFQIDLFWRKSTVALLSICWKMKSWECVTEVPSRRSEGVRSPRPCQDRAGLWCFHTSLLLAVALGAVDRGNREGEGVSAACQDHQLGLRGRNGNQRGPECTDGGEDQSVCFTHPQWNLMQGGNSHPPASHRHTHTNTHMQDLCPNVLFFLFNVYFPLQK